MTYAARPTAPSRHPETAWHVTTTILAVVGILVAALGAWMEFGPENGTLTLFGWTWNVADLSDLWPPFLMLGGGLLTALPMGIEAARDWNSEHSRWLIGAEALIAVVGVAAVVFGIVLFF